ncbi:MAG: FadR/GntR family transcriptional regulator [Burkholderiaceae bacterium]
MALTSLATVDDHKPVTAPESGRHLPDEIAATISTQIQRGERLPGERLPSERELCELFGVSRSVVREALSQLKSDGIIGIRRGSGAYVLERDQRQSFRIQDVVIEERGSLTLVMELIVAVEVAATRLAAMRRTPEDLKLIRRALIGMEYEIANDRLGDEQDFAFHQAIVEATHNPHFIALSSHLEQGARRVIRQARTNTKIHHVDLIEAVQEEHQVIFDAIKAGDPDAATLAAETHLKNAAQRLDVYLKS